VPNIQNLIEDQKPYIKSRGPYYLSELLQGRRPELLNAEKLDAFLELALHHGLVGMVQEQLEKQELAFPQWNEVRSEQAVRAGVQINAVEEIARFFSARKISAVFAKGVALSLTVYNSGVRRFADLDLLVSPQDFHAAHRALRELGYAIQPEMTGNPMELGYVRERLPGFRICVDLHWDFASADGLQANMRIPVADILSRARQVGAVPVPCVEDMLLLAAVNLGRKSAEPLMLIVDFARLAEQELNWPEINKRAGEWGVRTPLWLGLVLARQLTGLQVPAENVDGLAPARWRRRWLLKLLDEKARWSVDKQKTWRYRILFKILCADSLSGLLRIAWGMPKRLAREVGFVKVLSYDAVREAT